MYENGNLLLDEESHGENVLSIVLVIVSLALVVGLYYFMVGKSNLTSAKASVQNSSYNEFITPDGYLRFKYPITWSVVDAKENSTTHSQIIAPLNSDELINITISKVETDKIKDIMQILQSVEYFDAGINNIMPISFSQKNENDYVYEASYERQGNKIRSKDEIILITEDYYKNTAYIVSFEAKAQDWSAFYSTSKNLFDSIIVNK